jgi:hypothetical protein
MARFVEIHLEKRGASCTARLLDDRAPRTCQAVWDALPQSGDAYHAKYARNEVYTLVPTFADTEPGLENSTITPIPGDLVYFSFAGSELATNSHGYVGGRGPGGAERVVDLAVFYERNNLLLNPDSGWVPGNVFATVVEGLERFAAACQDLWLHGVAGERLSFSRLEEGA